MATKSIGTESLLQGGCSVRLHDHLAALSRMNKADRKDDKGNQQRRSLNQIIDVAQPLFPPDDAWIRAIKTVITKPS